MRAPWLACAASTALAAGAVACAAVEPAGGALAQNVPGLPVVAAAGGVGALIAVRRPRHPVGLLLSAFAASLALNLAGSAYAAVEPRLPGHEWAAWAGAVLGGPAIVLVALVLLVFPDGRLLSPRWRPAAWAAAAAITAIAAGFAVSAPLEEGVRNPLGVAVGEDHPLHQGAIGWALVPLVLLAAAASLVLRYRRAGPDDRLRLKWLGLAGVLAVPAWIVTAASWEDPSAAVTALGALTTLAVPVAIGVAILRHRLFDIDVIIRRSLVLAVLWALIAAVYVGVAAAIGIAAGRRLPVEVAIGLTIAATLAFQPARRHLDRLAERLVLGERPGRYETLERLGRALEGAVAADEVAQRIAEAVRRGLDLAWARVLLELSAGALVRLEPAGAAGIAIGAPAEPAARVELVHGDERLGVIECGPRREGVLGPADLALLETVARQAALGIRGARHAAELAASRARILQAQDAERRRLERDLHDGAQQHIVSLIAKLRIARNELARDPAAASATLAELQSEARELLRDVRELAQGIHPAVLSDRGLLEAVEARLARFPLAAELAADPALRGVRFAPEVEAAAYFFVSEALANVIKHARARSVTIALAADAGRLRLGVRDDGVGIDGRRGGTGLIGLADRLEGLGGSLRVTSEGGTCLEAELPLREAARV